MADHVVTTRGTQTCGNLRSDTPSCRPKTSRIPAHCGILRHPAEPRCGWFDPSRAHSRSSCKSAVFETVANTRDHLETIAAGASA